MNNNGFAKPESPSAPAKEGEGWDSDQLDIDIDMVFDETLDKRES